MYIANLCTNPRVVADLIFITIKKFIAIKNCPIKPIVEIFCRNNELILLLITCYSVYV